VSEGVSSTALRKRWWVNKNLKLLPDGVAVALLQAHEAHVYAPLKDALIQSVASKMPARMLSPNAVTAVALLTLLPFVAAVQVRSRVPSIPLQGVELARTPG